MIDFFFKHKKTRSNKGFSLAEVLLAIAILAIIIGIAVPSFQAYQKRIELKALDDLAFQLYAAAQNQLTEEKEAGLLGKAYTDTVTYCDGIDEDIHHDGCSGLYAVADSNTAVLEHMDEANLNFIAAGAHYIIEYNPSTGHVYSVFCAKSSITYDNVKALADREQNTRLKAKPMLGYYCSASDVKPMEDNSLNVGLTAEIINKEELYVRITGDLSDPAGKLGDTNCFEHCTLSLTVSDESGNRIDIVLPLTADVSGSGKYIKRDIINYSFEADLLLDSMLTGYDLKTLYPDLNGGENLTVTAKLSYSEGTDYAENKATAVSNSLFESNNGSGDIRVRYIRHLENLNKYSLPAGASEVTAYSITQTGDLDYDADNYSWYQGTNGATLDTEGMGGTTAVNPLKTNTTYKPVENSLFDGKTTFNGSNYTMEGFTIKGQASDGAAGIFGELTGWNLKNISVVDPSVSGSAVSAGALAGSMTGGMVDSCGVYIEDTGNYASYNVSGGSNAGGLVGKSSGTVFTGSFASVCKVSASDYAGGLVGYMEDGSADSCYGNSFILSASGAGGFAGRLDAAVSNSYAVAEKFTAGTGSAAGFTAAAGADASALNCYALTGSAHTLDSTARVLYGFAPEGLDLTDCSFYLLNVPDESSLHSAVEAGQSSASGTAQEASINEINTKFGAKTAFVCDVKSDGSAVTTAFSHPYDTGTDYDYLDGKAYQAPRINGLHHYGNWPDAVTLTVNYDNNSEYMASLTSPVTITGDAPEDTSVYRDGDSATVLGPGTSMKDSAGNYLFKCWNTAADGSGTDYAEDDVIAMSNANGSVTLYAMWEKGLRVTYRANAGTDSASVTVPADSNLYHKNDTVTVLGEGSDMPTREHFAFDHWNTQPDDTGTSYIPGDSTDGSFSILQDTTLYAIWVLRPYTVTLHVTVDGSNAGSGLDLSAYSSDTRVGKFAFTKDGNYTISLKNGSYDIYLDGYETGVSFTVADANLNTSLELYTLTALVKKDGTLWTGDDAVTANKIVKMNGDIESSLTISSGSPVVKGTSWHVYLSDNSEDYFWKGTVNSTTSVEANYFSVIYHDNTPGSGTVTTLPGTTVYRTGTDVGIWETIPVYTPAAGQKYGFVGWNKTQKDPVDTTVTTDYKPGDHFELSARTELWAQWSEKKYDIVYDANFYDFTNNYKSAYGTVPVDGTGEGQYYAGETAVVKSKGSLNRPDYNFIGWCTTADGSGAFYQAGDNLIVYGDVTLYAVWAYSNTYTIIFDKNGATGGITPNSTFYVTDTSVKLNMNKFTRTDYMFKGWSVNKTGIYDSASDPAPTWQYTNGQTLSTDVLKALDTDGDQTIRLYAVWEYHRTYSVSFELEKMSKGSSMTVAYKNMDYTATLTYEGGYNPPQKPSEITVYVDDDGNRIFSEAEKLEAITDYQWDPYTMTITVPASKIKGNIKIVASATAGTHFIEYYLLDDSSATFYTENDPYGSYQKIGYNNGTDKVLSPARSGYIFEAWYTQPGGKGTRYVPGDVIRIEENVKLYAGWKETQIVGAYIYNYYKYNPSEKTSVSYLSGGSTGTYYALLKGESQFTADGETYEIIDNGGQPFATKKNNTDRKGNVTSSYYGFTYFLKVPKGTTGQKFYYSTNNGSSWTEFTATKSWTLATNHKTDTRYPNGAADGNANSDAASFDYYTYSHTNPNTNTACTPEITNIKIVMGSGASATTNIFDFDNTVRPDYAQDAPGTRTADWSGITQAAPKVAVHNGNVPVLDRSYANFFLDPSSQADFTVTPDENGYEFSAVTLTDSSGTVVTTYRNLFTKSGNVYTFSKDAMAELAEGDYTVTFDYVDYDRDPSFTLHIFNPSLTGYRYIKLHISEIADQSAYDKGEGNVTVQFSEIGFCTDEKGINPYHFEESAVIYDLTQTGASFGGEDAYLCIDNNTRTKYCSKGGSTAKGTAKTTGSWDLIMDLGDGYQLNTNLYGYVSYYTAGDTWNYGRAPFRYQYSGSNSASVLASPKAARGDAGWEEIITPVLTKVTTNQNYDSAAPYKKNEVLVSPVHNNYELVYDLNAADAACTAISNGDRNRTGGNAFYGEVIVCYDTPVREGYHFLGWSENSSAEEADYKGGSHFNLIHDTTLYAVWSADAPTLAINYYKNLPAGAVESTMADFPLNTYITAGEVARISSLSPTLSGFRFVNWVWNLTERTAAGTDAVFPINTAGKGYESYKTVYVPGESVSGLSQNMTLYAQWNAAYFINVDASDGCSVSSSTGGWYVDKDAASKNFTFTVTVADGYDLSTLSVTKTGGTSGSITRTAVTGGYRYTIPNVASDINISVTVQPKAYKLTIKTDSHISAVTPSDGFAALTKTAVSGGFEYTVSIRHGYGYSFTVDPDEGYGIASASVDTGNLQHLASSGESKTYAMDNVTEARTVTITSATMPVSITYLANGGSGTMENSKGFKGVPLTLRSNEFTAPAANKTFACWDTRADGLGQVYSDGQTVTIDSDITLYAIWADKYSIVYDLQGGTDSGLNPTEYTAYTPSFSLKNPTREGFTFTGWSGTDLTGSDNMSVTIERLSTGNRTFSAHWRANAYTVTFDANGGSGTAMAPLSLHYADAPVTISANTFTRAGYIFTGWNTTDNGTGTAYGKDEQIQNLSRTDGDTVTLYAQWKPIGYLVRFNKAAEEAAGSMSNQAFTYDEPKNLSANQFIKTGYTFDKWTRNADGSGDSYTDGQLISTNLTDTDGTIIDVFAQWKANNYKVRFNSNGGSGSMADQTFTYDQTATLSPVTFTAPAGKFFENWTTAGDGSGSSYLNGSQVENLTAEANGTIDLYAQWANASYTVAFSPNGGSGATMDSITLEYGQTGTIPACGYEAYDDYRFKGWALSQSDADAHICTFYPGDSFSNLTDVNGATVILYAVWVPRHYLITFNANGGSGSMEAMEVPHNTTENLTPNAFTRGGYSFTGWSESANGAKICDDEAPVQTLAAASSGLQSSASTNLYALWAPRTYTITLNPTSNSNFPNKKKGAVEVLEIEFGSEDHYETFDSAKPNDYQSSRTTYYFEGWKTTSDATDPAVTDHASLEAYLISLGDNSTGTLYASYDPSCFASDTLITMADGAALPAAEIKVGDLIKAYDFVSGSIVDTPVIAIEVQKNVTTRNILMTLDNGSHMNIIGGQAFFDMDSREYFTVNTLNYEDVAGRRIMVAGEDGISSAVITDAVLSSIVQDSYELATAHNFNFFGNGILSCEPLILANTIFEVGEDYSIDSEQMAADIASYGLYDYSEFAYVMTEEMFDIFNVKYFKVAVGKGLFSKDLIYEALDIYSNEYIEKHKEEEDYEQ